MGMHIDMSIEDWMLRSTEQSMVALADSEYSSGRRVLLVLPSREQCLLESPSSLRIDSTLLWNMHQYLYEACFSRFAKRLETTRRTGSMCSLSLHDT